jgi:crossover junction endodeoxyribonuclease RusA
MIVLNIPALPPSVNSYWNFHGHQRFLTKKAIDFKVLVAQIVSQSGVKSLGSNRLEVIVTLYPPDKRARDLDNNCKSLLDALCQSGLFDDDSQIDVLTLQRGKVIKGGKTCVFIEVLPS